MKSQTPNNLCNQCPRKCNALRTEKENINGFCRMPLLPKVARADLHFWEEPCISGKNGSGTVFFSGCPLKCVFCQNMEISAGGKGEVISYQKLAEIFKALEDKGAHNINLVSPTHYVDAIKKTLDIYKPKIPIVYNSGGYDSVEALRSLEGYIDIYLTDLKYLSSERAKLYSRAENYPEIAEKAILEAYRQQGKVVIENGIMQKGVIIRHLLLPQGTREAIAVFDFVRQNTPEAYFSIMSQYTPLGEAESMPIINRKVTKREYEKVLGYIAESGFGNVFIQERTSADK
ncbi:MAG: radical SAM protein, partial [Clostridia bacterium]|nr:radical SAM protein [Clostridia bacterium]